MVLGSVEQLADETAARQAIATLRLQLNRGDAWLKTRSTTVSELVFRDPLVSATVAPASTRSALAPAVDTCAPSWHPCPLWPPLFPNSLPLSPGQTASSPAFL